MDVYFHINVAKSTLHLYKSSPATIPPQVLRWPPTRESLHVCIGYLNDSMSKWHWLIYEITFRENSSNSEVKTALHGVTLHLRLLTVLWGRKAWLRLGEQLFNLSDWVQYYEVCPQLCVLCVRAMAHQPLGLSLLFMFPNPYFYYIYLCIMHAAFVWGSEVSCGGPLCLPTRRVPEIYLRSFALH